MKKLTETNVRVMLETYPNVSEILSVNRQNGFFNATVLTGENVSLEVRLDAFTGRILNQNISVDEHKRKNGIV